MPINPNLRDVGKAVGRPYDRDNPSTFTKQRKCGGCGSWFDLTREGTDYPDETTRERVTLCGECCDECEQEADEFVAAFAFLTKSV